jgi:hypothetical protein
MLLMPNCSILYGGTKNPPEVTVPEPVIPDEIYREIQLLEKNHENFVKIKNNSDPDVL